MKRAHPTSPLWCDCGFCVLLHGPIQSCVPLAAAPPPCPRTLAPIAPRPAGAGRPGALSPENRSYGGNQDARFHCGRRCRGGGEAQGAEDRTPGQTASTRESCREHPRSWATRIDAAQCTEELFKARHEAAQIGLAWKISLSGCCLQYSIITGARLGSGAPSTPAAAGDAGLALRHRP